MWNLKYQTNRQKKNQTTNRGARRTKEIILSLTARDRFNCNSLVRSFIRSIWFQIAGAVDGWISFSSLFIWSPLSILFWTPNHSAAVQFVWFWGFQMQYVIGAWFVLIVFTTVWNSFSFISKKKKHKNVNAQKRIYNYLFVCTTTTYFYYTFV